MKLYVRVSRRRRSFIIFLSLHVRSIRFLFYLYFTHVIKYWFVIDLRRAKCKRLTRFPLSFRSPSSTAAFSSIFIRFSPISFPSTSCLRSLSCRSESRSNHSLVWRSDDDYSKLIFFSFLLSFSLSSVAGREARPLIFSSFFCPFFIIYLILCLSVSRRESLSFCVQGTTVRWANAVRRAIRRIVNFFKKPISFVLTAHVSRRILPCRENYIFVEFYIVPLIITAYNSHKHERSQQIALLLHVMQVEKDCIFGNYSGTIINKFLSCNDATMHVTHDGFLFRSRNYAWDRNTFSIGYIRLHRV